MQRRAPAAQSILHELISSGIHGQLRDGDTLGVWTYAEQLQAGRFPLQHWTTNASKSIAQRIAYFLQSQTNDGPAQLEKVLPVLHQLVKDSEFLTIVLVHSGDQPILGTPFDERINATYRLWQAEQQRSQMPFVTVLRAVDGKLVSFAVTAAPWPVELPPISPELPARIAAAAAKKPVRSSRPATPVRAAAPLIFSGSDPKPSQAEPVDVPITKEERKTESRENTPVAVAKPEVAARSETADVLVAPALPRSEATPAVSEANTGPAQPATPQESSQPVALKQSEPTPAAPKLVAQTPAVVAPAQPTAPASRPEEAAVARAPHPMTVDSQTDPVPPVAPKTSASIERAAQDLATASLAEPDPTAASAEPQPAATSTQPPVSSVARLPAPLVGAALQDPPWVPRAVAITCAALACMTLILFLMAKPRPAARGSLITRSLDRDFGR